MSREKILSSVRPYIEAVIILAIGWWVIGLIEKSVKRILNKAKIDAGATSFMMSILKAVLRIIIILCAVSHLGVNITPLLTALGAAAVTISLALKDSLSNIASGMLIVINKMFCVGDHLKVDNIEGQVCKIEIFFTTLLTGDNKEILIPNSKLTSNVIINSTAKDKRRLDLVYTVDYNSDLNEIKNILKSVIDENSKILNDPQPAISIKGYGNNGTDILVKIWCATEDYDELYDYMQLNVKKAFDKSQILIPFNRLDVNLLGGKNNGI